MAEASVSKHLPADTEAQMSDSKQLPADTEAQMSNSIIGKGGGFITLFFISGTLSGVVLSGFGWLANIIVYLVEEFNVKRIDATQISNVVHGCIHLIPILGAIIADSYLGTFSSVAITSFISSLGMILLTLTAKLGSLKPPPCETGSSLCKTPSKLQFAILYLSMAMASAGLGGGRYTLATMGANQLDKTKDKETFFNWFFFTIFASCVISSTALVYVEENISWALGFAICFAANFIALAIFLSGYRFYKRDKPHGSPFTDLLRVVVATVRKRRLVLSSRSEDYYHDEHNGKAMPATPKKSFRFLNQAAMKTEGDINSDGSIAKPWKICTVQQVEDLKTLIRLFPIWSSGIFLTTPITTQSSISVIQALSMDRHLGSHFKIPAASIVVVVLISSATFVALFDRLLFPAWQKLTGRPLTPLQRIGIGHVVNVLSMAIAALVESKRLKIAHAHGANNAIVPMLVWWLFPQLIVVGIGDALHFPGHTALFYQEFPASLRSTATAMISLVVGIAFYVSTAMVDLIRNMTGWLPENINNGRLDNLYWILVTAGSLNFIYFLVCANLYKYQNIEKKDVDSTSSFDM